MLNLNCRLVFPRKIVTHSPLCHDVFRLRRDPLQLLPQAADVHVHGAVVPGVGIAPHQVHQAFPAVDTPGIFHQQLDQVVFLGRQVDGAAVPDGHPLLGIQGKIVSTPR